MASNAIDMELENTVFVIAQVQFSVARIIILFIQFPNTVQNTSYVVTYTFFSTDFVEFHEIQLIAQSCTIFGRFWEIEKFQKACLKL